MMLAAVSTPPQLSPSQDCIAAVSVNRWNNRNCLRMTTSDGYAPLQVTQMKLEVIKNA
ncbi:hypothetical protein SESBI_47068 [Sesbania bispinosa]|nr:hypothetical protein SESBI_47068 [Sesbania bispinosa]